jgi:hypothetical protein
MEDTKILQNIKKIAPKYCDNCGHMYNQNDFNVLKAQESNALLHLKCPSCGNTYVINAFVNNTGYGSQRMPLVLDLEGSVEIEKFAESDVVSKDYAIDLFDLLNSGEVEKRLAKSLHSPIRNIKSAKANS